MSPETAAPRVNGAQESHPAQRVEPSLTLVVFSGELDRWMAAFTLANAAAAMGTHVSMYFAFWGVLGLRKERRFRGKSLVDRLFTAFLPKGVGRTSRMNFLGLGPRLFGYAMRKKNVAPLDELIGLAGELGVRMVVCQMSMDVMGVGRDELVDGVELGGAAVCVRELMRPAGNGLFL